MSAASKRRAGAILAALVPFALLLAVWGVRAGTAEGGVKNPDSFVYLTIGEPDSLDPAWAVDIYSIGVIQQVYESLLAHEGSSVTELAPAIAERVPTKENGLISHDGRVYRFPIRAGVRFHDGSLLTPEDVKYSLMRFCLLDRPGGPSVNLLEPILGIKSTREGGLLRIEAFSELDEAIKVEGREVVVRLKEPLAPFLSVLAMWAPVVSRNWTAARGGWDGSFEAWERWTGPGKEDSPYFKEANGTGPFRLTRWDRTGKTVVLERHDTYWRGPAALKRAFIRTVEEFSTRKLMLAAGDADAIFAAASAVPELAGMPGVLVEDDLPTLRVDPIVFFTFAIESKANPWIGSGKLDGKGIPEDFFADLDIRKGFAHSLDAEGFLREVARGKGEVARGPIAPGLLGGTEGPPPSAFDPKLAEAHFRKAWSGEAWRKGFRMTLAHRSGDAAHASLAAMLKRNVEALNPRFEIELRALPWSAYLAGMSKRKLPVFIAGLSPAYADPHAVAYAMLHSRGLFGPFQGFGDSRLDDLIERARREVDPARRRALYGNLQARARELTPQVYVLNPSGVLARRAWIHGGKRRSVVTEAAYASPLRFLFKRSSVAPRSTI